MSQGHNIYYFGTQRVCPAVSSGDANIIFDIRESELKNKIHLILDDGIRKDIERELGLRKTP